MENNGRENSLLKAYRKKNIIDMTMTMTHGEREGKINQNLFGGVILSVTTQIQKSFEWKFLLSHSMFHLQVFHIKFI
jgi:hypothetical protein